MCVGSSSGTCLVYDVRSAQPLYYHSHHNFEAIKHVEWKAAAAAAGGGGEIDSSSSSNYYEGLDGDFAAAVIEKNAAVIADTPLVASGDAFSIHIWRCSSSSSSSSSRITAAAAAAADWISPLLLQQQQQQQQQYKIFHNRATAGSSSSSPRCAEVIAHIEAAVALPEDDGAAAAAAAKQSGGIHTQNLAKYNNFVFYPHSGLCFTACERRRMGVYFLPSLGISPRWCSFLDSITEELEEGSAAASSAATAAGSSSSAVYDDYKFVTRQQLEQLGVDELIGSALVKRYMHGYFMDAKLYRKLKETLEPFDYDAYRRERVQQKLEEKKKMRIEIRHKAPKTNAELARRLEETASTLMPRNKKEKMQQEAARELLTDNRFEKLFLNPDFEIEAPRSR